MRPDCTCRVLATKLSVIVHNFAHQLFDQMLSDRAILAGGQFRDRLRDSDDHFIGFIGIDFVRSAGRSGVLLKEIVNQFNHHAMKAGPFLVITRF